MGFLKTSAAAAVLVVSAGAVHAATYNFVVAANDYRKDTGAEYNSSLYNTSEDFVGKNVAITADNSDDTDGTDFVYFDSGTGVRGAGIGVCGAVFDAPTNSGNTCNPSSDDGITKIEEILTFTATEALDFDSIWLNNNHDLSAPFSATAWAISFNGAPEVVYNFGDFVDDPLNETPSWRLDIGRELAAGDYFSIRATHGPNSYVSAIAVSSVPLPAAGWLLLAGLGGVAAMKRRKS